MPPFAGFPTAALDFYDDLEVDNSRSFWEAHKNVYAESVRAPMVALCEELEPEFGEAKVFRPHRDVRFSRDKTPYKTHQGAFVSAGPATGWYVQLSAAGVMAAVGFYGAERDQLAALRAAIADGRTGPELVLLVEQLRGRGWELGGDTVKTAPRGYSRDHPRIDLLRHRSLTLSRHYGFGDEIQRPDLVERVRADWRAGRSLVEWVLTHST